MKMIKNKDEQPKIKPSFKALIKSDSRLMQALLDRWDISVITLYQWIQKDYRKLFLDDSLSLIESHLKLDRSEFVINPKN